MHPAMPITVMKKRFLYRMRLRAVTLWVKVRWFQIRGIRSRKTRLPALGAFGSIRRAGFSRRVPAQADRVASMVHRIAADDDRAAYFTLKEATSGGRSYMIS